MIELKSVVCNVDEQETTITFSRKDNCMNMYTSDNTQITKMSKLINIPNAIWKLVKVDYNKSNEPTGYFFRCDNKKGITIKGKNKDYIISEERKQEVANRFRNWRNKHE